MLGKQDERKKEVTEANTKKRNLQPQGYRFNRVMPSLEWARE